MKKAAIVAVILLFFAGIGIVAVRYTWFRVWQRTVTSNGVPISGARVYRHCSGDILLDLRGASGDVYIVHKSTLSVGTPSNYYSVINSPAAIISRLYPLPVVNLESEKAGAIHPNPIFTSEKLSFVAADGKTILVSGADS